MKRKEWLRRQNKSRSIWLCRLVPLVSVYKYETENSYTKWNGGKKWSAFVSILIARKSLSGLCERANSKGHCCFVWCVFFSSFVSNLNDEKCQYRDTMGECIRQGLCSARNKSILCVELRVYGIVHSMNLLTGIILTMFICTAGVVVASHSVWVRVVFFRRL